MYDAVADGIGLCGETDVYHLYCIASTFEPIDFLKAKDRISLRRRLPYAMYDGLGMLDRSALVGLRILLWRVFYFPVFSTLSIKDGNKTRDGSLNFITGARLRPYLHPIQGQRPKLVRQGPLRSEEISLNWCKGYSYQFVDRSP